MDLDGFQKIEDKRDGLIKRVDLMLSIFTTIFFKEGREWFDTKVYSLSLISGIQV